MRQTLCALAGVGLLVGTVAPGRAQDQADAKRIVDKAIQAMGGEARLAKFQAATIKAKGTFFGMGAGTAFTEESAVQFPRQYRVTINSADFKMTIVLNGDKGWAKIGDNTVPLTGDRLAAQQEALYAGWVATLTPLRDKDFTLSALGESKVGGQAVQGVKVSHKGRPDVRLFFAKDGGLLLKSEYRGKDEMSGQEVNQATLFSDYKLVEGVQEPMKVTVERDGKKYVEEEITELKHETKLPDRTFSEP